MISYRNDKYTILTGFQPSGHIHLGNYIGSILNCKSAIKSNKEKGYDVKTFIMIADLHSLNTLPTSQEMNDNIINVTSEIIACFDEFDKNVTIFLQSSIPAHTELSTILSSIVGVGELERMTQYKDKKRDKNYDLSVKDNKEESITDTIKTEGRVSLGLFSYPVLQAADILLYNTNCVPVGEDQKQHLELTQRIAQKFNRVYNADITIPEAVISNKRIMSLIDTEKKMNKSNPNTKSYISLSDDDNQILSKIKNAKTDSIPRIYYDETNRPEVSSLLRIISHLSNKSITDIVKNCENKKTLEFKLDVAQCIIKTIGPIRTNILDNYKNKNKIIERLYKGKLEAEKIAQQSIAKIKKTVGMISL